MREIFENFHGICKTVTQSTFYNFVFFIQNKSLDTWQPQNQSGFDQIYFLVLGNTYKLFSIHHISQLKGPQ